MCVAHGGAAPQVSEEARVEQARRSFDRAFARSWAKYQRALVEWQAQRIATVSRLLSIPADRVGWAEVVWCHTLHGVPPLEHEAPKVTDFPLDGRLMRAVRDR